MELQYTHEAQEDDEALDDPNESDVPVEIVTKGKSRARVVASSPPVNTIEDSDEEQAEQFEEAEEAEGMQVDELSDDQGTSSSRPSKVSSLV